MSGDSAFELVQLTMTKQKTDLSGNSQLLPWLTPLVSEAQPAGANPSCCLDKVRLSLHSICGTSHLVTSLHKKRHNVC